LEDRLRGRCDEISLLGKITKRVVFFIVIDLMEMDSGDERDIAGLMRRDK
jgi:hypothetical protein